MAIKVFPSCRNLALTLQQSSGEHFLENFEENTHAAHAVFRPRGFRGQTGLGVCKWDVGAFLQHLQHGVSYPLKRDFNLLSSIRKWYHINLIAA